MQVNSCITKALSSEVFVQYNDVLLQYYQDNGATSDNINDAAQEFLVAHGITLAHINDMWQEFFEGLGYSGSLSDMWYKFWCEGGGSPGELAFFALFGPGMTTEDRVSGQSLITTLSAIRPNDVGTLFGEDEPVLSLEGLNTYGPYTNLIAYSEDISNAVWIITTANVNANTFKATAQFGGVKQIITTSDSVLYTFSFIAYIAEGVTTNYAIRHFGSAMSGYTAVDFTSVPTLYEVTVLGASGGGTVTFGVYDRNTSDWTEVTITDFQVTESPYRLPYIKTEASAVSVPLNYSDADEGYKYQIRDQSAGTVAMPLLLDALEGNASDNIEMAIDPPTSIASPWISEGAGVYSINNPGSDTDLRYTHSESLFNYYVEWSLVVSGYSGSAELDIILGGYASIGNITADGVYSGRVLIDNVSSNEFIYIRARAGFIGTVSAISIKQISDAQGEMQVEWIPKFDYGDTIINSNLLTSSDAVGDLLYHTTGGFLYSYDHTTTTAIGINFTANTKYIVKIIWGTHPTEGVNKFQIIVTDGTTTWSSAVTNFDGSFDPEDWFSVAWGNEYWQQIRKIAVFKAPYTWTA